jgi:hypothetical protein
MLLDIYIHPKCNDISLLDISLYITAILPDLIDSIGDNFQLSIYEWGTSYLNLCIIIPDIINPNLDLFYEKNKEFLEVKPHFTLDESEDIIKRPDRLIKSFVIKNGVYYST